MMRQSGTCARRLASATLGAGLVALLVGCILDLDPIASCGDGYVEPDLEECDPGAEDGPLCDNKCRKITINCGNGTIDPGEACDTVDFGNKDCKSGKGFLTCKSDCTLDESTCNPCGDGKLDPGEECDPNFVTMDGGFADPVECASLGTFPLKPYTTGVVTYCTDECMWYRGPCGYCGDNEADPPIRVDLNFPEDKSEEEYCDGVDAPIDNLSAFCDSKCPIKGLECKPQCLNDCSAFDITQISSESLQCCLAPGTDCPDENDPAPCCVAYQEGLADRYDPAACREQKVKLGDVYIITHVCR